MARPCHKQHELSPDTCRLCWLTLNDPSYALSWREPHPLLETILATPNAVQIQVTADGLGDHLLGLTASEGLRRQGHQVVYCAKGHIAPWLEHVGGYDWLVTSPIEGIHTFKPHDTYQQQLRERTRKPRWEYYADVCGTKAVLPERKSLPAEPLDWARQYTGSVVLCPFSAWKDRTWMLSHWLELERLLKERGHRVLVCDNDQNRSRAFTSEKIYTDPLHATALLYMAGCVVANDSGMAHVGAIQRTPTVAVCALIEGEKIFGIYPTVKVLNGPFRCTGCHWGGVLRAAAGCSDQGMCGSLAAIRPEQVADAVDELTCRKAIDYSLLGADRLSVLARLARECSHLAGDYVEVGSFRGGSALRLATAAPTKKLHVFDNFEGGLPSSGGEHHKGEFACSVAEVEKLLAGQNVEIHPGIFPQTAGDIPKVALAHIDVDVYESCRDAIAYLWPRLVEGGSLVFDDIDWPKTPGINKALAEADLLDKIQKTASIQGVVQKVKEPVQPVQKVRPLVKKVVRRPKKPCGC